MIFKYFKKLNFQTNGPNVNIKVPKKSYFYSIEERTYFNQKLKFKQKTEVYFRFNQLCKNWVLYNDCYFKDTCSFAHGEKELRYNLNIDQYKTKICHSFSKKMYCSYGLRCQYSHVLR